MMKNLIIILLFCGVTSCLPLDECRELSCVDCLKNNCVFCILKRGQCYRSTSSCDPSALVIPPDALDMCPAPSTVPPPPSPPPPISPETTYFDLVFYIVSAVVLIVAITFGAVFGLRTYHGRFPIQRRRRQQQMEIHGRVSNIRYRALEEAIESHRIRLERHNVALDTGTPPEGHENPLHLPCPSRPLNSPDPHHEWSEEEIIEVFHAFDVDGDGVISIFDLRMVMVQLGVSLTIDEIVEMIELLDGKHDASVTFEEFREFLRMMDKLGDDSNSHF